tara:strand:+ start:5343 stop:6431 length:1089 start_codon:yes stop_codon:yes gene_type:complete
MILELINIIDANISLLNLLNYLTVRAGLALFSSFLLILLFGPRLINFISSFQDEGQPIREDGPQSHLIAKKGTPTMGGIIILLSITFSVLLWSDFDTGVMFPIIFIMLSFGFIGFIDDFSKVTKNSSNGISGRVRLILQTLSVGIFIYWTTMLLNIEDLNLLTLPLLKDVFINLGYFSIPFTIVVIVGSANAVNLTDGLDGLAIVPVMIVAATFAIICYLAGNVIFSDYLHINYVSGAGELAILCGAMIGASLGFLWYNAPPAMVFMGDTGSLALGGTLGAISVIIKQELVLAIVGGIFVAEALSVILQVGSFKLTGKRIFKMAPLHHHFEHKGWPESQIVIRFWIIALILALIGLATLKIR